jgi:hypothetical protein
MQVPNFRENLLDLAEPFKILSKQLFLLAIWRTVELRWEVKEKR